MTLPLKMTVCCCQTGEYVELSINEIQMVQVESRVLVFYTEKGKYKHLHTLTELEEMLEPQGFDMLDKTNLVNLKKVVRYDEDTGKVFFTKTSDEDVKYATVSMLKQKLVRKYPDYYRRLIQARKK